MGKDIYSSYNRAVRTNSLKAVKISGNDIPKIASFLADHGITFASAGSHLTMNADNAKDLAYAKNLLAESGLDFALGSMDSRLTGYSHRSGSEIFDSKAINSSMNPYGVLLRESRDSAEHPESLAIVLGLDETGSMGSVPHYLVKEGLPTVVEQICKGGILHPQILFLGVGDHLYDQAPLQVGQFESSDELMDKWLTDIWLEGQGGGNDGESYLLVWWFAAFRTAIDCFEKRGRKGYCITIGDEPVLGAVPASFLHHLMGEGQYENYSATQLIAEASKKYHVHHVHVKETGSGSRQRVIDDWRQLLRDNLHVANRREDIVHILVNILLKGERQAISSGISSASQPNKVEPKEEMIL